MVVRTLPARALKQFVEASGIYDLFLSPWMALAGILMLVRGQWLWHEYPLTIRPGGVWALGGLAVVAFSLRSGIVWLHNTPALDRAAGWRFAWGGRQVFALAGIGLALYTGWRAYPETLRAWDLLLMWALATWLTIYGLVPGDAAAAWWETLRRSLREERWTWAFVGLIFLVALVVRTAWLETSPYIMGGDSGAFAIQAAHLKDKYHWQYNPFQYGVWHHPRIYHTLMGVSIDIFGQTKGAARAPSALLGAFTAPAVYLMGRRMFDRRVGLAAAICMATYPLHVHFSRQAIIQPVDPLFAALALAFFSRAMQKGNQMEAALAGAALGLSQYGYSAARLIPLLMVVYVGLYVLYDWRTVLKRAGVLAIVAIVAAVIVFPNLYAVYKSDKLLSPRLEQVSVWEQHNADAAAREGRLIEYWSNQIQRAYMAYVHTLDEGGFYGAYDPVLGWYAGVPFLIGLVVLIRRWRDPQCSILLVWAAAAAFFGGAMLVDPPQYSRYVSVTPGLIVPVGVGLVWIGETLMGQRWLRKIPARQRTRWLVPVGMAVILALVNLHTYVLGYLPKKIVFGDVTVHLNEVVDIVKSVDERYRVWYFSSLDLDMGGADLVKYLLDDRQGSEFGGDIEHWREVLSPGSHVFLIAPERFYEISNRLIFEIPNGTMHKYIHERTGDPLVYAYFVEIPEGIVVGE